MSYIGIYGDSVQGQLESIFLRDENMDIKKIIMGGSGGGGRWGWEGGEMDGGKR